MYRIENFHRGWIIGDFSPAILRTNAFEVGLLIHKRGEIWPSHFHARSSEYNLLVDGLMVMNDQLIHPGDIFVLAPNEIARPEFLEDCRILVVKVPSIPSDKFIV